MIIMTKKELLEKLKDLKDDAEIYFNAYHYELSGRRSSIADDMEIEIAGGRAAIIISEEKPECLEYND